LIVKLGWFGFFLLIVVGRREFVSVFVHDEKNTV